MEQFGKISKATIDSIVQMLEEGELSIVNGGLLEEFERFFASLFGHKYAVATCNGTAAIHSAYFALEFEQGDEFLVPTYGFHAMTTPAILLGGVPIFCDVDASTLAIDVEKAKKKISNKTKAIMVLQPWGNLADAEGLRELADQFDLKLISDSSHAHTAKWEGKPLGAFYDVVCASLGKGKLISGGELGILTTNSARVRDRALLFGHTNRVPKAYATVEYSEISNNVGVKYRPHALALKIALDQGKDIEKRVLVLRDRAARIEKEIVKSGFALQVAYEAATRDYWKVIGIGSHDEVVRLKEISRSSPVKIESNHYSPLQHQDSVFTKHFRIETLTCFDAEGFGNRLFQIDALKLWNDDYFLATLQLFEKFQANS